MSTAKDERAGLIDHLNRCRNMLGLASDRINRQTLADLVAYLEKKLAALDGRET
jgi:hypothetical protein